MVKRRFNWQFAVVLILIVVVLVATMFAIRAWRHKHMATQGLTAGNKAYSESRWEDAAQELGRYLSRHPDDIEILNKYANSLLNIRPVQYGNVQQALNVFRSVLRIDKSNKEAGITLIEIYMQLNDPVEADHIARQMLEVVDDTKIRIWLAAAMIQQRQFTEASKSLKEIIQSHPDAIWAYELLGQLTLQRPELFQNTNAEVWYSAGIEKNPGSPEAYLNRAEYYLKSGQNAKAISDLAMIESRNSADLKIQLRLVRAYSDAGDPKKAQAIFEKISSPNSTEVQVWLTAAVLAQRFGDKNRMQDVAENGLRELQYQKWDFMPTAIELFIHADNLDRAQNCIAEMRRKDVSTGGLYYYEGMIADLKGQPMQAIQLWTRAIESNHKTWQVRLLMSDAMWRTGDKLSALQQIRTAISENPNNGPLYLSFGMMAAKMGYWDQVVEYAQKARELMPKNPAAAALYYRGCISLNNETHSDNKDQGTIKLNQELSALEKEFPNDPEFMKLQFQLALQSNDQQKAQSVLSAWKGLDTAGWPTELAEVNLLLSSKQQSQAVEKLRNIVHKYTDELEPLRLFAIIQADKSQKEVEDIILSRLQTIHNSQNKMELVLIMTMLYDRWQQPNKACDLLTAMEKEYPDDIRIKRQLLRYSLVLSDADRANKLVEQIKSLEGEDGWQWRYEKARFLLNSGNLKNEKYRIHYQEIVDLLAENLRKSPNNIESQMLLAYAHQQAGHMSLSLAAWRDCYNRAPDQIGVIIPTISALNQAGEYQEAAKIINRAGQQWLAHPLLSKARVQNYVMMGEIGAGVQVIENMLQTDPENQEYMFILASLKIKQGHFDEAESILNQLRAKNPDSISIVVQQIQMNLAWGKPDQAVMMSNQLVEKNDTPSTRLIRANTYVQIGNYSLAKKDIDQVIDTSPTNIDAWLARSNLAAMQGRQEEAVNAVQKALSMEPDNSEVVKKVLETYLFSSQPNLREEGRNILSKELAKNPDNPDYILIQVRYLLSHITGPNVQQARTLLEKLTAENPRNVEGWRLLGDIAVLEGQYGKAIDLALRGLAITPNDKKLLLLKVQAEKPTSPVTAISTLNALHDLYPPDVEVSLQLADAYLETNSPAKAQEVLESTLSKCQDKDKRSLRIVAATARYYAGDKENAMKELDTLAAESPEDIYPLLNQAGILAKDQRWNELIEKTKGWIKHPKADDLLIQIIGRLGRQSDSESQKTAKQVLLILMEEHPNNAQALGLKASFLLNENRAGETVNIYKRILEINPGDPVACNNLAWLLCEKEKDYAGAMKLIEQGMVKSPPEYVDILDTRGYIYYQMGDYKKSVEDFKQCMNLYPAWNPAVTGVCYHLGLALMELDQGVEAKKYLKQALDLHQTLGGLSDVDREQVKELINKLSKG